MQWKEKRSRGWPYPINLFIYKNRHIDIHAYPLFCAFYDLNNRAEFRCCGRPYTPRRAGCAMQGANSIVDGSFYEKKEGVKKRKTEKR